MEELTEGGAAMVEEISADSRGPTNGGDREPKSQDEADDPEGQGGARGFGNRGVGPEGVDPEGGATED